LVVVTRPRTRTRPRARAPMLDRALGTSRRRRQAAYLAIGAGLAMLRPTLRRLAVMGAAGLFGVSLVTLFAALRWG
jgi:hypothetical protein